MNQPDIAYLEITPRARRNLVLRTDHVVIKGEGGGVKWESRVILSDLRSEPDRLWYRDPALRWGSFFLVMFVLALALGCIFAKQPGFPDTLGKVAFAAAIGWLVGGVAIFWKFGAMLEYARFLNHSGVVSLDIARRGPQQHEFDDFVSELSKRIADAQNN